MKRPALLLSFDVEEFDMPLEYGQEIPVAEQLEVGRAGLRELQALLADYPQVRGTLFTTAFYAQQDPEAMRALAQRHEIASHTFYHSRFATQDLWESRTVLEAITGSPVTGLRMPRMRPVPMTDVREAGYSYDSSVNPCWLPGRYDNRHLPRGPYTEDGMLRFPASVTPRLRIPLFWLAFKNAPYPAFRSWVRATLKKDGYACLYFHPWEFTRLDGYRIPGYAKARAGAPLQQRLRRLIEDFSKDCDFLPMAEYIKGEGLGKV
ncbi:polysaccharide deacetylase family protein [Flaviaesturariibacter terrae]